MTTTKTIEEIAEETWRNLCGPCCEQERDHILAALVAASRAAVAIEREACLAIVRAHAEDHKNAAAANPPGSHGREWHELKQVALQSVGYAIAERITP